MKALAKDAFAWLLYRFGLSRMERIDSDNLLILTFHRVLPDSLRAQYPLPGLAVSPDELRWILGSLIPYFEVMTVSDAHRNLCNHSCKRPQLAVSFDDGQWDNLFYAAPVLKELDIPATFYVPTDFIDSDQLLWHDTAALAITEFCAQDEGNYRLLLRKLGLEQPKSKAAENNRAQMYRFIDALKSLDPQRRAAIIQEICMSVGNRLPDWARLMTWAEVCELYRSGHEIGSHGCTHQLLTQLSEDEQRNELEASMRVIQREVGAQPTSLCYPNGDYSEGTLKLAQSLGYENAVTTKWGINPIEQHYYELRRCDMDARRLLDRHSNLNPRLLSMRLSGYAPGLPN